MRPAYANANTATSPGVNGPNFCCVHHDGP
jgi:hypothetical protein